MKHDIWELQSMQAAPLSVKVLLTKQRIREWVNEYGEVVPESESQMSLADLGLFDKGRPTFHTTGCQRTGCMFCGFGCHLEKESRFQRLHITHPKVYDFIMRPWDEGGLNYKEVIDWINEHGNLDIKY